jgi:adenylate cyclase
MRGTSGAAGRLEQPSTPEEGAALARRYERHVWHWYMAGALCGGLPLIAQSLFVGEFQTKIEPGRSVLLFAISTAYAVIAFSHARFAVRRRFRPISAWLVAARPADDAGRTAILTLPRRIVLWSVWYWAGLLVWGVVPLNMLAGIPNTVTSVAQGYVALIAGWFVAAAAVYLLVERSMRPLTGLAVRGVAAVRPSALGVLPRLLMVFGAAVAAPLVGLGFNLAGITPHARLVVDPFIWTFGGIVLAIGFAVMAVAARSVTDPLNNIREGLRRLQSGDFEVELDVDEPGEIGELQAGFNELVDGLRERERMREVFVRLVGKDVAEHALAHASGLEGERCEATAIFVDVIGSTSLGRRTTEFDYWTKLNSFFDVVVRVVEDAGGFVNKFEGDGALCIFGAPVKRNDHAAVALTTARLLRAELDRFAESTAIETAIGVSTGGVVAGYVGTADRYEFTVVGDAVNEAKRLTDQAKTAETKVLVSEATIRAAQGELAHWREAAITVLRGREVPTVAYSPGSGAALEPQPGPDLVDRGDLVVDQP